MGIKSAERSRARQSAERRHNIIQKRCLGVGDKVPTDARFDVLETGLGQIPEQGERTLTHLWHFVLRGSRGQREVSVADARRRFIR